MVVSFGLGRGEGLCERGKGRASVVYAYKRGVLEVERARGHRIAWRSSEVSGVSCVCV